MTLKELLSHFKNKTIWVDLKTPLWEKCGEIKYFERELNNSILDMKVSSWNYTNSLNIEII